jgi:hypothetical protein
MVFWIRSTQTGTLLKFSRKTAHRTSKIIVAKSIIKMKKKALLSLTGIFG